AVEAFGHGRGLAADMIAVTAGEQAGAAGARAADPADRGAAAAGPAFRRRHSDRVAVDPRAEDGGPGGPEYAPAGLPSLWVDLHHHVDDIHLVDPQLAALDGGSCETRGDAQSQHDDGEGGP